MCGFILKMGSDSVAHGQQIQKISADSDRSQNTNLNICSG